MAVGQAWLWLWIALEGAPALVNGDFEAKAARDDPIPGWSVSLGARNGAESPLSEVALDRRVRRSGKQSLHFSVSGSTYGLQIVGQEVEARPGAIYTLTGFARTEGVHREVNGLGIQQHDNCYVALFLFDGNGELVGRELANPRRPSTQGWEPFALRAEASESVRRVEVKAFLTVSGELWVDDLTLTVEGGAELPAPAPVFHDDFEGEGLAPAWLVEEGARNGGEEPISSVEVARLRGRGEHGHALHLAGDERTLLWRTVDRWFEVTPGDALALRASVRAEDVQQRANVLGIPQFANWHGHLVFYDEGGEAVGAPRYVHPGTGSYGWKPVEVRATAPEGSVRGTAGFFLSMSGDVWIDDVTLERQPGGVPAYDGWQTYATERLVLRYPPDHPWASDLESHAERFEQALAAIETALEIEVREPITMFLYRDDTQGKALTGRPLAYAEAERRAVHQGPTNTPGHELVHVVALDMGYAQTGLFGEGLAVWLDGQPGAYHHARAAELLRAGTLPSLDALLDDFRAQEQGYPAAGSFVGWILETYGLDALRRLYPVRDLRAAFPQVVGKSVAELEEAWRAALEEADRAR